MIAIVIENYLGIGDAVQFSHIPENFYKFTGKKVFDVSNSWIYNDNPFVERGTPSEPISETLNPWILSREFYHGFKSHAERFFDFYNRRNNKNFKNPPLRHLRLYSFEQSPIKTNRIVIHTTGKSEIVPMTDEVIEYIAKAYSGYEIIQTGGLNDKKTPFINKLGLDLRSTIELIATSAIFIGVNSGMMNIANCYPRVNKKILLPRDLENFSPLSKDNTWFDYGVNYYNYTENDIGATFSYLKL
jgi:hypothetical protein